MNLFLSLGKLEAKAKNDLKTKILVRALALVPGNI